MKAACGNKLHHTVRLSNSSVALCKTSVLYFVLSPLRQGSIGPQFVDQQEAFGPLIKAGQGLSTVRPSVQHQHSAWDYYTHGSGINPNTDMGTRDKRGRRGALLKWILGLLQLPDQQVGLVSNHNGSESCAHDCQVSVCLNVKLHRTPLKQFTWNCFTSIIIKIIWEFKWKQHSPV